MYAHFDRGAFVFSTEGDKKMVKKDGVIIPYWVVALETMSGAIKIGHTHATLDEEEQTIKDRYLKKHPSYVILDIGQGMEHPKGMRALPKIK